MTSRAGEMHPVLKPQGWLAGGGRWQSLSLSHQYWGELEISCD